MMPTARIRQHCFSYALPLCLALSLTLLAASPALAKPDTEQPESVATLPLAEDTESFPDDKPLLNPAQPSPAQPAETAKTAKQAPAQGDKKKPAAKDKGDKAKAQKDAAPDAAKNQPLAASASYQVDESKLSKQTLTDLKRLTASLQEQSQLVFNELKDEQELSVKDIAMLWQAAVERSGTIRYAIEKLSRRDATGKAVSNDSLGKRVLQSVARVGGVAGTIWTGTPAGMLGGNMLEQLMHEDPTDPSQLRVTDADMLILAKEVDALQSQVIETYYQYRHSEERWKLSQDAAKNLQGLFEDYHHKTHLSAQEQAIKPLMDSMLQSLEQEESNQKQAFINARNSLGLLVGGDALVALEKMRQQEALAAP